MLGINLRGVQQWFARWNWKKVFRKLKKAILGATKEELEELIKIGTEALSKKK